MAHGGPTVDFSPELETKLIAAMAGGVMLGLRNTVDSDKDQLSNREIARTCIAFSIRFQNTWNVELNIGGLLEGFFD